MIAKWVSSLQTTVANLGLFSSKANSPNDSPVCKILISIFSISLSEEFLNFPIKYIFLSVIYF